MGQSASRRSAASPYHSQRDDEDSTKPRSQSIGSGLCAPHAPRLLQRDMPFHQCSTRVNMQRSGSHLWRLGAADLFHVALGLPLWLVYVGTIFAYTAFTLVFLPIYILADPTDADCGLSPAGEEIRINAAFLFSLETMTTIGYGIPYNAGSPFEDECRTVLAVIWLQAMLSILMNASCIGLIFARLSRASNRASQIIFSDKAVVRCVRGRHYLFFRVAEASFGDYTPAVEAHVRLYAVLHEGRDPETRALFQTRVCRLTNPNDELGGFLFLATPQVVSHRIDPWSPLAPPAPAAAHDDGAHDGAEYHFPGVVHREADREVATADEQRRGLFSRGGAAPPSADALRATRDAISDHIQRSEVELVALVEAIDPFTSATFQARHSWRADDIVLDHEFAPVMTLRDGGGARLDWSAFHTLLPVAEENARHVIGSSHS